MKKQIAILSLFLAAGLGCTDDSVPLTESSDENSQQVGDAMASIDEIGGNDGQIALENSIQKTFHRMARQNLNRPTWNGFIQDALASCLATFGSCSSNTITRTFGGCKIGRATFEGTVDLVWDGASANCRLVARGDTITRIPDFTVTGLRDAKLTVTKTGATGQTLEWVSGTGTDRVFSFTNDGINRKFTVGSMTLFDFTTKTTKAITVTGTRRTHRVIDGGKLEVTNNRTDKICTYTPNEVTWEGTTCNCPVSGTWEGTCTGDKKTKIEITGCGTADVTVGDESSPVTFDRCEGISS